MNMPSAVLFFALTVTLAGCEVSIPFDFQEQPRQQNTVVPMEVPNDYFFNDEGEYA